MNKDELAKMLEFENRYGEMILKIGKSFKNRN